MSRKPRLDSTAAAVAVLRAVQTEINPLSNVPLDASEFPFFASVLGEFAKSKAQPQQNGSIWAI